ncbi:MAG: TetR/AcrR family transcriptional regulator [Croceibacterium sp.]
MHTAAPAMQSIQFVSPTPQAVCLVFVIRPPPKFCSFLCENLQVHVEASGSIGRNDSAVSTPLSPKPARVDGRRLRSERTKQLIIEAYLALLRENPVVAMPTAAQIAERAGYSVRSIFERFPDLAKLRVAAADYGLAQAAALAPARHVDADRATRIRSQVETRAGTCERGVALWRVLLASVAEDEELKLHVRLSRDRAIERLEIMYRPELSTLAEQERKYMLIALEAITDMESWERMREMHGLSFEEACSVWIGAIDRMLPPTPAA